jgi:hypothetical protein
MSTAWTLECDAPFCRQRSQGRHEVVPNPSATASEPSERVCRCARLLALALHFEKLLRSRQVRDYAELAVLGRVSRPRITQIIETAR